MTSTRNLLAYGLRVLRTDALFDNTRDPILTMLSIGMEKLYKLTLGLIALDCVGQWPTKNEMTKRERRHNLVTMHQEVMDGLRPRTADKSRYVRGLLADVDADPVLVPMVEVLTIYGQMGRFYYLDLLGDAPQVADPEPAWDEVTRAARDDGTVELLFNTALKRTGDNQAWEEFGLAVRERIAAAVERVWVMVAVCGQNHALGSTGAQFGDGVRPGATGR